jgi:hypothetical protein
VLREMVSMLPPTEVHRAVLEALGPVTLSHRQRAAIDGLTPSSSLGRHPGAWMTRLPVRNRIAFLAGSAVPSKGYLATREPSTPTLVSWWAQQLRWLVQARRGVDVASPTAPGRRASVE